MVVIRQLIWDDWNVAQPILPFNLNRDFERWVAEAGVHPIRIHDLRHTHATLAIAAGSNIGAVSRRVGHARTSITTDVYAHVLPEQHSIRATLFPVLVVLAALTSVIVGSVYSSTRTYTYTIVHNSQPAPAIGVMVDHSLKVVALQGGDPAERAGVQVGDVLVSLGGVQIAPTGIVTALDEKNVSGQMHTMMAEQFGKVLPLVLQRNGQLVTLNVQPAIPMHYFGWVPDGQPGPAHAIVYVFGTPGYRTCGTDQHCPVIPVYVIVQETVGQTPGLRPHLTYTPAFFPGPWHFDASLRRDLSLHITSNTTAPRLVQALGQRIIRSA